MIWPTTVGFYILQASLCCLHHGGSCLHSSAPLECDQVNVSWTLLPTTASNPWLTSLFLSLQMSRESPFLCRADDSGLGRRNCGEVRLETSSQEAGVAHLLYSRVIYGPIFSSCWDFPCLKAALSMALIFPRVFWFYSKQCILYGSIIRGGWGVSCKLVTWCSW